MSDKITVKAGDRGLVWVFAVDLDGDALKAFTRQNGSWRVQEALGVETLDPEHVDIFPVKDLAGVGLAGYLEDGLGVPEAQLADTRSMLDATTGTVMVLTSKAFGGAAQTFTPRAPLRLLASFSEDRPPVAFEPLPSEAATGSVGGPGPGPDLPEQRNRMGSLLLLVALVLITALALMLS